VAALKRYHKIPPPAKRDHAANPNPSNGSIFRIICRHGLKVSGLRRRGEKMGRRILCIGRRPPAVFILKTSFFDAGFLFYAVQVTLSNDKIARLLTFNSFITPFITHFHLLAESEPVSLHKIGILYFADGGLRRRKPCRTRRHQQKGESP
jgi:hypothetical protein